MIRIGCGHIRQVAGAVSEYMLGLRKSGFETVLVTNAFPATVLLERKSMQRLDRRPVHKSRLVHWASLCSNSFLSVSSLPAMRLNSVSLAAMGFVPAAALAGFFAV
jgi:hypothetical protein